MKLLFPVFACGLLALAGCGTSTETAVNETADSLDSVGSAEPLPSDSAESTVEATAEPTESAPTPEEQLAKLTEDYNEKYSAFLSTYREAKTQEDRTKALELRPKTEGFVADFFELAEAHPESEAAVDALIWVSQQDRGEKGEQAKSKLLSAHSGDPKILPIVFMMMYGQPETAEPQLRGLLQSPETTVRATATYALGSLLMRQDEASTEAKELLQTVVEEYADVSFDMRGRDFKIAPKAEGALFALNNLQIGMEAPDIEGSDLNGVEFKLSDYRGKVVLLDFWGNW